MSYSRRQLEALGEPLGESVTRKEGGRIIYGGGGSGAPEKQTTVTELPDWAKPAAQNVLAKGEALTAREYAPYGGERIAGFQPLQQQAFGAAEQLGPSAAGQFGTGLAGAASVGALGAGSRFRPYQTGQFGAQAGQYMSPFIQQALEPQMREAVRASEIQRQADQAQAVQRGAFGGSRQAIVEAERQRNLGTQLGDIQSRGLQTAFQQAQDQFNREQQLREQSRQYGAGLGMQGFQTALQGAGQLGALGQQQFGQQKEAIGLQSQLGGQQQALEQQRMSQQYQDFLNQQRYPYQQLEFMSNLIRGTPMGTVQSMYAAQPTMAQNIGALGMGAYGIGQLMRAEGGTVSSYAEGGSVTDDQNVDNILDKLSDAQLHQARDMAMSRQDAAQVTQIDQELAQRASIRSGLGSAFNAIPQERQEQMMAGGGVVAFSGDEDENEAGLGQLVGGMMPSEGNPEVYKKLTGLFPQMLANVAGAKYTPMSAEKYNEAIAARRKMLEDGAGPSPYADIKEKIASMRGDSDKELSQSRGLAALKAASAMVQGRGLVRGLAQAGGAFGESYGQALQADKAQKRALMNMEINAADALRKERMGLNRDAIAAADQARKDHDAAQQFGIRKAQALANVAGKFATATKPTKAGGSGAGKGPKINEQLAAAEIAHETNPTNATLATVTALRRAVAQTKTSDFGPARANLGEAGLDVRLGEAITTAQQKIKFTPEYLKADAAGKQQMLRDVATQVRANAGKDAGVNDNSTPGAGSGKVEGLPAGATVKGDKVYDSSGKLIGHVK
jgi:hypothetical protein